MPPVALEKLFLLLMQVAWIDFVQHTKADAIRNCSIFTSCIDSYADIYKSLTSEENSFNIESALYPAMMPSSLVVKVQIFGPNETSVANYTWSVNCLYVAFPAEVLQLLSFGSILVTPRMQDLNICIPHFCSNFSSVKEQKDLMKGVLAALQDLAVSPGIRDPRLNTAECVIEGHKPNITATGRSSYIRAFLWCSFIFTFSVGPFSAIVILDALKTYALNAQREELVPGNEVASGDASLFCWCKCECCQPCNTHQRQNPLVSSIICLCYLLFSIEIVILGFVFKYSKSANAPCDIYIILGLLVLEGTALICFKKEAPGNEVIKPPTSEEEDPGKEVVKPLTSIEEDPGNEVVKPPGCCTCDSLVNVITGICANLTVHHFCWLVIGIMINPTWGLAVLLIVCFFGIALTYTFFKILNVDKYQCKLRHIKHIFICIGFFCSVCSLVVLAVLAGQSFFGRETADDLVKTVLLYVISGFISWISWLKAPLQRNKEKQEEENGVEPKTTDRQKSSPV